MTFVDINLDREMASIGNTINLLCIARTKLEKIDEDWRVEEIDRILEMAIENLENEKNNIGTRDGRGDFISLEP